MSVSIAKLEHWLEHDPDRFERYLAAHPDVADRFEQLTALPSALADGLERAFSVPDDVTVRLRARLEAISGTEPAAVALDLLGVGSETLRLLFDAG